MTMSVPGFSVIIAAHGRESLLARLLESLDRGRATAGADVELLVVDSTPAADAEAIRDVCDRVDATLIEGPLNVRRKRNLGARSARFEWLLFVDSDCQVSQDIFRAYRHAFEANAEIRAAAGPTVFRGAETTFTQLISASSLLMPFRRPSADPGSLLWATTSNLLVRREAFEAIGGFREDFPFRLGGDDTDFCLRLRACGHRVAAVPDAVCYHSWATWSRPSSVVRRSFRWGWMHARLLRDHPCYRRFDAPGLPAHTLACLTIAITSALAGAWQLLLMPALFVTLAVVLHAAFASARASNKRLAFQKDLTLALVELPFGFGRAIGSLAAGSLVGVLYRLDVDDAAMDAGFPETVRSLWSDHLSFVVVAGVMGWAS